MNHDMRVGDLVLLRETDVVGLEGYHRRWLLQGHRVDDKRRPHLVVGIDRVGVTLLGCTARPMPYPSALLLPPELRRGFVPQPERLQWVRDVRRPAVVVWGSPAALHIRPTNPWSAYEMRGGLRQTLRAQARAFGVPLLPADLIEEMKRV